MIFNHEPCPISIALYALFQGHLFQPLGFPFRLVDQPHRPNWSCFLQPFALSSFGSALSLFYLATSLHHILNDVDLVVHNPSVSELVAHSLGIGRASVGAYLLGRLGKAVLPQQLKAKRLPTQGVFSGLSDEHQFGVHIRIDCWPFVPLALVYVVGSHPQTSSNLYRLYAALT